ncbi:hypothetical protein MRX96_036611 [Rhipicephalus microplus]
MISSLQTPDLVNWMKSLGLDLLDRSALATVNPVEMMVRGSLDLVVEAVISITFSDREFVLAKRLMEMRYSRQQDIWKEENHGLNDYVLFLAEFGATSNLAYDLASKNGDTKINSASNAVPSAQRERYERVMRVDARRIGSRYSLEDW